MDMIQLLKEDHQRVKTNLEQIINRFDREMMMQCARELQLHMRLEESILYPEMQKRQETRHLIDESYGEHQEVKDILERVSTMQDEQRCVSELKTLLKEINHHVTEEENELFPQVQQLLPPNEIEHMTRQVMQMREREMAEQRF